MAKTGLKPDSVRNMVFGAGVLYRNFYYGTHYRQTFDEAPKEGKKYYFRADYGTDYTLFEGDSFNSGTAYYEEYYEGYGGEKIGATKDGTKVTVTPEYTDIEVDGILVKMEGLTRKTGEKATIEAVVLDMSVENVALALNGEVDYLDSESGNSDPNVRTKSEIEEGDYIEDLALVANKIGSGDKVIVWFKKALCTSGLDLDMKNKSVAGNKYTFEAYAEQSDENVDTLPIKIISMKKKA